MSEFLGHEYNYAAWQRRPEESAYFKTVTHAGEVAPDFTLPQLNGGEVTLSSLRGRPVVMEFGSIT